MRRYLLFLALWPCAAAAQPGAASNPGPIRFHHLNAENLSQTSAILQDHEGFMWFGKMSGGDVARYDGQSYTHFSHDPYDSLSIASGNMVTTLYEDSRLNLWVAKDTGLNRFDRTTGTFRRFLNDPEDPTSLSPGGVLALLEDRKGRFWIGTRGGLNRMDRDSGTFERHMPDSTAGFITALLEARDGSLWAGSWGLVRFDPETGVFSRYLPDPDVSITELATDRGEANLVTALHEDPQGRLWVGADSGSLYRFDPKTGTFAGVLQDPSLPISLSRSSFDRDSDIRAIADDPEGGLWLATGQGLVWVDPETGNRAVYVHDPLDRYSLSGNDVRSLYRDRQGVFWVGTFWRDVDRFDRAARPFAQYYAVPGKPNSLPFPHVFSMVEGKDGTVWISTFEDRRAALTSLDRRTGTYRSYFPNPTDPAGLDADRGLLMVDREGMLWSGGPVLSRMDPSSPGRFTHFTHDPEDPRSLGPGRVWALLEDSRQRLWAGSLNFGLSRLDDRERGVFTRFPLADDTGPIDHIQEDAAGRLWIGTYGGLFRLDPESGAVDRYVHDPDDPNSLIQNMVFGVWERPQEPGVLWLGMMPVGLGRFDPSAGSFRLYTTADGLPDNDAQGVIGDEDGNLWISTDHGLSRFNPDTGVFTNFDVDDGLQGESFTAWSYHKSRWTGELFFGGPNGMNAFFPRLVRDNPHPPLVVLTALSVGGHLVQPGSDGPLQRRLQETETLTLTHQQNDLAIDFVALHFRHPEKNRYTYILEGFDEAWSDTTSTIRRASYTNLPPGDYLFRVSAANSDGVWTTEPRSLAITVLPPWWRTNWAYALYGLLFLGGVFGVDRVQRRRLVARERERTRERELAQAREIERQHTELTKAHESLKATQTQLVQSEKLASLGQLTAGIAHEIKNPLNFVNNFAEINEELAGEALREIEAHPDRKADDLREMITGLRVNAAQISRHGRRADAIVASMMAHASASSGERLVVDVNDFVAEYVRIANGAFSALQPNAAIRIDESYDPAVGSIRMGPQELGKALVNILSNAFEAVSEHRAGRAASADTERPPSSAEPYVPTVTVSTRRTSDGVEIRLADNGPGIPPSVRDKIFEPFFTTKPTGQGTGLGLSLAHDIVVKGHGGTLGVESEEGKGATFVVTLPHHAATSS